MTDNFFTPPQKEARVLPSDIGPVIPVVDIEELLGYSRSAINKAMQDHEGKINPCKTYLSLPTPGGNQQFVCLNRDGVDYLLLFIHPSKSRMSDDEYIEFRRGILDRLTVKTATASICAPFQQPPDITAELTRAREEAAACRCDPFLLCAAVYLKHGEKEKAEALQTIKGNPLVIPDSSQPGIWMTPTDIGRECGLSAREVNSWLYNHDFQYPDGSVWRLTGKGESYGEEYPFTSPYKHTEIRIRWHRSILYASGLKRPMPESQMQIPARTAGSAGSG